MQISKEWSGFTGGQADTLRKAVGKKKIDLMRKMKVEFVEGAIKHSGAERATAEKFWDQLEEFANYCFNKSHAACYGLISYWTAYLKAHYPDAFMAAVMTSDQDDIDRLAIEITECRHMGLNVLNPDVNQSFVEFAVVPDQQTIRFGMAAVKGVGTGAVEEILRAREDGTFLSIADFAKRVSTRKVNRKAWESLVRAGAFDELGDRSDILFNLDTILGYASKLQKEALAGQADLFGGLENAVAVPEITLTASPEKHSDKERLQWERELLGLYLSAHPLDKYDAYFEEQCVPFNQLLVEHDKKAVIVGGVVSTVRTIVTKSGSKMAFMKVEDKSGEGEVIIFPNLFEEIGARLTQDLVVRVSGKISSRDREGNSLGEAKIIADEVIIVSDEELDSYQSNGKKMKAPKPKALSKAADTKKAPAVSAPTYTYKPLEDPKPQKVYVHVKDPNDHTRLKQLKQSLNQYPGSSEIILVLGEDKGSAIRLPFLIEATDALRSSIGELYGADCVVVK